MNRNEETLIKNYLANLSTQVIVAGFNKVSDDWREIDYTPDYSKFYFILDGEGWLRIDGREYYPKPGQLFFMPQGIKQSYSVISKNVYTKHWCHFTARVRDMNLFDVLHFPCFVTVKDTDAVEGIFVELRNHLDNPGVYSSLMQQSCILRLLSFFLSNSPSDHIYLPKSNRIERLNGVLMFIDSNYHKNITIDELAKIAHLHPNYFIRLFKKHIGMSPIHYLNKKRIEEAKYLLTYTNLPLKRINKKIGMSNIYYFSRVFKKYTGFAPSDYRQLIK